MLLLFLQPQKSSIDFVMVIKTDYRRALLLPVGTKMLDRVFITYHSEEASFDSLGQLEVCDMSRCEIKLDIAQALGQHMYMDTVMPLIKRVGGETKQLNLSKTVRL